MADEEGIQIDDDDDDDILHENLREQDEVEFDEEEEDEEETRERMELEPQIHTSSKIKLIEMLKRLHSPEIKIYSEASKEFIGSLKGESGGDILREYVQLSPKFSELMEAWKLHQGKPGMSHISSLVSVIIDHPTGKSRYGGISRNLDTFARSIFVTKLDDIYAELNSQELRRQSTVLSLLASVVRRGMGLASDVAKSFDFKLPVLSKLSRVQKNKGGKEVKQRARHSTRQAFVGFAMSFLEVGNPRLLRWILQQRAMYSGVLRGLASDDAETVVYVLSTLRDKVLTKDSLVPPGLRSVLFGSITLEQLSYISGNPMGGPGAEIAHEVLVLVCTNPCNGLMPGTNLKGNEKRLFELMKILKATEVKYHKDLLLSIVKRRLSLCSAYMDEFPYYLEPRSSSLWFSAISLAADMISSIKVDTAIVSVASCSNEVLVENNDELHSILKCIIPPAFTRSVINKGLLHHDILVKHGSLRLLLESLKTITNLITPLNNMIERASGKKVVDASAECASHLHGLPGFSCFVDVERCLGAGVISSSPTDERGPDKWGFLKQYIQDEVRTLLPDPQVLLKLLSSLPYKGSSHSEIGLKRSADLPEVGLKKLKTDTSIENVDIVISGIDAEPKNDLQKASVAFTKQELDVEMAHHTIVADIWGLNEHTMMSTGPNGVEDIFHSKLLDVLTYYLRTMPNAFEGSFDFFKVLPADPLSLSTDQQYSLLSLLAEYIRLSQGSNTLIRASESMYKHLQPLINLLIYSQVKGIQDQAYSLIRAAMASTGAFDQNLSEIDAWLLFLPCHYIRRCTMVSSEAEAFDNLSAVATSFLCDAVSTVGNNLYKYWDHIRKLLSKLHSDNDVSPGFSPLILCILQKCLRLLESDSETFTLCERSMISLYVCNTLSLILQNQVDMRMLSGMIHLVLSEKIKDHYSVDEDSKSSLCEWRPLKNLFRFVGSILDKQGCNFFPVPKIFTKRKESSFFLVLSKIKEFLGLEHGGSLDGLSISFTSALICATPDDIVGNFPLLLTVAQQCFRSHLPFLSLVLFLEPSFLADVANLWPDMFFSGFEMIACTVSNYRGNSERLLSSNADMKSTGLSFLADRINSTESAAAAFSCFLKQAPFYVLFSAVMGFDNCQSQSTRLLDILYSNQVLDLLQVKLSEGSLDDVISYLGYVLFWSYQIMLSYKIKPSDVLEELFRMSIILIDYILDHLVGIAKSTGLATLGESSVTQYVVDLIFQHPIVSISLSAPFCSSRRFTNESLVDNVEIFLSSSKQNFHPMDRHILHLLTKVFHFLLAIGNGSNCSFAISHSLSQSVLGAPRKMVQKLVILFKENFELCIVQRDVELVLPSFYILHSLMQFVSPFELLELVHWIFFKLEANALSSTSAFQCIASVGLYVAGDALDMLYSYLQQPSLRLDSTQFWGRNAKSFDATILPKVYYKFLDCAICFNKECADVCLFKVVNIVYSQKYSKPHHELLPLYMLLSRIVIESPLKMLVHCFYRVSKTKAKTLLLLTEISPIHMNLFGQIFLDILNKDLSVLELLDTYCAWPLDKMISENCNYCLLNNDFVLLLPAALLYLTSRLDKYGEQDLGYIKAIPTFYADILLDGFSNWRTYVDQNIFQEEYDGCSLTSLEDYDKFCGTSLLGKSVLMLHYFFMLCDSGMKKRLEIFDSIYPHSLLSEGLFDCDLEELGACSYKECLKIINVVAAKVSLTRLLLFLPVSSTYTVVMQTDEKSKMSKAQECNSLNCAKLRFMSILVNSLDKIVRKCPLRTDSSVTSCNADCYNLLRLLEHSMLRNIVQLSLDIQNHLTQLPSVSFLFQLIRSSLLHRFEDPFTLKAVRYVLVALMNAKFSAADVLMLLLGHSQFVPAILCSQANSGSSTVTPIGSLLQPVPSILKLVDEFCNSKNTPDERCINNLSFRLRYNHNSLDAVKLELIRLLRVLYYIHGNQQKMRPVNVDGMNSRELLFLLLSGYSATLSETDLEIFHLMHEIESVEGSESGSIAEMDYLWGDSALKIRKEDNLNGSALYEKISDCEEIEERRKMLVRENIPIDSKLCAMTVLHFCNDRSSRIAPMSLKRLVNATINIRELSTHFGMVQRYDPAFILRFSIHSLSMSYLEPTEFSRLGLLAVTFASISSPDEELRKLGYASLGKFKQALENRNKKDVLQLQLLLTYLQNGITEEWQKIPSVVAVFAAEASLILSDPSHNHFLTVSKFLMRSPRMSLKSIPLFDKLFESGSIHFKTDRLWILQLLYAGLNSNVDAKIYTSHNLSEILMGFCSSSLCDIESKILILHIVKKAVKFHTLAHCLVKECGLLPWISSIISFYSERLSKEHKHLPLKVMELSLKIINDAISSRMISEWVQECALEQLSELSTHLHKLLVVGLKTLVDNVPLVNSILSVMVSTLKLSQKRRIYQPHLNLSLQGLVRLSQAISVEQSNLRFTDTIALGIRAILMSSPTPAVLLLDRARLSKLLVWAIPFVQQSLPGRKSPAQDLDPNLLTSFEEQLGEEFLVSKLLRWVTASVILGNISKKFSEIYSFVSVRRSKVENLQHMMEEITKENCESREDINLKEALAVIILYLQQILGKNLSSLHSVVSALCLLLLNNPTNTTGKEFLIENFDTITSLCSKIRSPAEANPSWRWSYYQPWKDLSSEQTGAQQMEEEHACQSLLLMFSNALGGKSLGLPALSHQDVEQRGFYVWERDTILGSRTS